MDHSKHASFSRATIQPFYYVLHIHTHSKAVVSCAAVAEIYFSLSLSHTHTHTHTAQHFNRLITATDWQDRMDPLKSAQKKSSRHRGSYKHRHTQTTHLITSVPQSERTIENAFYINTKFVKANWIIRI